MQQHYFHPRDIPVKFWEIGTSGMKTILQIHCFAHKSEGSFISHAFLGDICRNYEAPNNFKPVEIS